MTRITESQLAALEKDQLARALAAQFDPRAEPVSRRGVMGKWEADYSGTLTAGGRKWVFETLRLCLYHGRGRERATWYTPDFLVAPRDGDTDTRFEIHEVKGHRRRDSMVRLKACATSHAMAFRFFLVTRPRRGGGWEVVEL